MVALVEAALAEGACGASSGLEYTPGAFASLEELIALCRPLGARRLVYATHMRNEDERLLDSIDEAIAVARGAGCPLHISHLKTQGPRNWSKLDQVFARLEHARTVEYAIGVRVVLVNGALALRDGEQGPHRAGRPLRVTAV
jgi:N-acyl-D-amino-acid deacylase